VNQSDHCTTLTLLWISGISSSCSGRLSPFADERRAREGNDSLLEQRLHFQVGPLRHAVADVDVGLPEAKSLWRVRRRQVQRDFGIGFRRTRAAAA
jgi:hypothetical protein